MDIEEVLSLQLPHFREPELADALSQHAQLVTVPAGTPILQDGQYVKTIPLLLTGLVKVAKQEADKEMLLYYIYPR